MTARAVVLDIGGVLERVVDGAWPEVSSGSSPDESTHPVGGRGRVERQFLVMVVDGPPRDGHDAPVGLGEGRAGGGGRWVEAPG